MTASAGRRLRQTALGLMFMFAALAVQVVYAAQPTQTEEHHAIELTLRAAEFVASDSPTPPAYPADGWTPVTLPDNWVDSHPGLGGFAWYRVPFRLDAIPDAPLALYVPHVSVVGSFYLNGSLLNGDVTFDTPHGRMGSSMDDRPLYIVLPTGLFHTGDNTLYVRLQGDARLRSGISALTLGPAALLKARQAPRYFAQVVVPNAVFAFVICALIFLLAHLWHRRSVHLIQLVAVVAIVNLGVYMTLSFPISRATEVFIRLLVHIVLLWALVLAGYRLTARRDRWFLPLWHGVSIATIVAAVAFYAVDITGDSMWMLAWPHTLLRFIVLYWMFLHAWRNRSIKIGAIALSATLWNLSALQSAFIVMDWLPWDTLRTSTIGVLPFCLVMLFVFAEQFILDREQAAAAQRDAIAAERGRILQEMHDGMGAHLIAALHLARREDVERGVLVRSIEDSIQDMRSIIDSLDLDGHDLVPLLANLRSRLEPRLKALRIELKWGVAAPLPPIGHMTPGKALAVLRIVQESLNNAIQHAQARTIRIAAQADGNAVRLEIADDGLGFDQSQLRAGGRGIGGMRTRAKVVQASLEIISDAGTTVILRIPCALEVSTQRTKADG